MIGGTPAYIENYPSMAYLFMEKADGYDYRGGAAIIGMYWAITAAHCLNFIPEFQIKSKSAFVGSNTSYWENNFVKHQIIKKYVHTKFDKAELDFDVGLVKVETSFDGIYEKPIKFANINYKYNDNTAALALGWGTTNPSVYSVVSRLRFVKVKLKNFKICQESYAKVGDVVTDTMICAGAPGKDVCVYDSGGPLYQNNILIGLISWGSGNCGHKHLPSVYTKLSMFSQWIRSNLQK